MKTMKSFGLKFVLWTPCCALCDVGKTLTRWCALLIVSQFLNQWSKSYWIYSDFHHLKLIKNYKKFLFNQSMSLHHIVFSIFPMTYQVLTLDVNDIWIHTWTIKGLIHPCFTLWPITFEHFSFQYLFIKFAFSHHMWKCLIFFSLLIYLPFSDPFKTKSWVIK